MDRNRIKDLQFIYKYSEYSIFCAEVMDAFDFLTPFIINTSFNKDVWYYVATFHLKQNTQLKFVFDDEGFKRNQLFIKKGISQWKPLYSDNQFQHKKGMVNLHEILLFYRMKLKPFFANTIQYKQLVESSN